VLQCPLCHQACCGDTNLTTCNPSRLDCLTPDLSDRLLAAEVTSGVDLTFGFWLDGVTAYQKLNVTMHVVADPLVEAEDIVIKNVFSDGKLKIKVYLIKIFSQNNCIVFLYTRKLFLVINLHRLSFCSLAFSFLDQVRSSE